MKSTGKVGSQVSVGLKVSREGGQRGLQMCRHIPSSSHCSWEDLDATSDFQTQRLSAQMPYQLQVPQFIEGVTQIECAVGAKQGVDARREGGIDGSGNRSNQRE